MDLDEIKNLIETDGGRFVFIENGKPILAAMKFEDYKKILEKFNSKNPEPACLSGRQAQKESDKEGLPKELINEPLKIGDLPI